jgi:hypothetical protein
VRPTVEGDYTTSLQLTIDAQHVVNQDGFYADDSTSVLVNVIAGEQSSGSDTTILCV